MSQALATFAGGCFWCMVKPFDRYDGVESVISGYTGGDVENPSYELVCTNTTGHREAVQITFDDDVISYEELLNIFWRQIDPTDSGGQFFDRGESYETVIFTHTEEQNSLLKNQKVNLKHQESLINQLPRRFYLLKHFILLKKDTKIII